MNLIEQLGGYENSRGLLNLYEYSISFKYYKEFDGDFESAGHVDVFIPDLKDALLQYRRQHNIFEVGDDVVYLSGIAPDHNDIYELSKIGKMYHVLKIGIMDYNAKFNHIRHTTDAEIKAGRRL